jgi:hypothetical protein
LCVCSISYEVDILVATVFLFARTKWDNRKDLTNALTTLRNSLRELSQDTRETIRANIVAINERYPRKALQKFLRCFDLLISDEPLDERRFLVKKVERDYTALVNYAKRLTNNEFTEDMLESAKPLLETFAGYKHSSQFPQNVETSLLNVCFT